MSTGDYHANITVHSMCGCYRWDKINNRYGNYLTDRKFKSEHWPKAPSVWIGLEIEMNDKLLMDIEGIEIRPPDQPRSFIKYTSDRPTTNNVTMFFSVSTHTYENIHEMNQKIRNCSKKLIRGVEVPDPEETEKIYKDHRIEYEYPEFGVYFIKYLPRTPDMHSLARVKTKTIHEVIIQTPKLSPYNDTCPICTMEIEDNNMITECGHQYHQTCFIEYLKSKGDTTLTKMVPCPVCNKIVNKNYNYR